MKQALEALEKIEGAMPFPVGRSAITSLRAAIEQAEKQEPFAWCIESEDSADWCFAKTEEGVKSNSVLMDEDCIKTKPFPLYTTPQPQREWVGLTNDELFDIAGDGPDYFDWKVFGRAIEAKLKEKSTWALKQ